MELWIATGNKGKLTEFKMLFNSVIQEKFLEIFSQADLPVFTAPPEDGDSFVANARIKARSMKAMKPGHWVMGEDSGIAVDGLKGLPGIHSARYAGPKAQDAENTAKLLKMMTLRPMENRKASFISAIVAYDPNGQEHVFEGKLEGEVAKAQKGAAGFGYDNVFIPTGEQKTLAELGLAYKNKVSHRAKAVSQFSALLLKS